MAENGYKDFFFYLTGSFFALSLALAFPAMRFDWLAILAALAFWSGGFPLSAAVIATASFGFAAFSLHPAWQLALPLGIGVGSFHYLQEKLTPGGVAGVRSAFLQGVLLAWLLILDKMASAFLSLGNLAELFSWQAGVWGLATLALGLMIPFFLGRVRFPFSKDRALRNGRPQWPSARIRGPFGLEKGL